jgi:hypothetical protein
LPAYRGLHARAIQNLSFDFGSRNRLRAHRLDRELIALFFPQVPDGVDEHASVNQELLFGNLQTRSVPLKPNPIGLLLIPGHE